MIFFLDDHNYREIYEPLQNFKYNYNTLALPNFFWKKSQILFYFSDITTTTKRQFREPPVDRWGAENI